MRNVILSLSLIIFSFTLYSQSTSVAVSSARLLGKTQPLHTITPKVASTSSELKSKAKRYKPKVVPNFKDNQVMPTPFANVAQPQNGDPLRQLFNEKDLNPIEPLLNIEGMDEADSGVPPPDPVGAIGRDHYIQMVNSAEGAIFEIFDKDGNSLYGPATGTTIWSELSATGLGDGIAIYDNLADRWVLTELGLFGTNAMLIGVSATSDPLGEWYVYEVQAPNLPDYPKYSMWPNGYYITTNEPSETFIPVYCLNREAMLAGEEEIGLQRLEIPKFGAADAFQVAAPIHFQGSNLPPNDSPAYFVRIYDDAWEGGEDKIELWQAAIDWDNPDNSTMVGPIEIPVAAFDSELCNGSIFDCLTQGDGSAISALQHVVMFGTPYRNFGAYEGIALNFSVDVTGNNQAGIRWMELRRAQGGSWELFQEATYSPDTYNRFMGSIGMDAEGNLLMGYSVMGADKQLSLRYTGRMASDPLGEMTIDEYEFGTGESYEGSSRWGDYAAMTVDPIDQRTFWFTGEYRKPEIWGTKIIKALLRRDTNDIGVVAMINPVNSGYLTANESVTVAVRNFGYNAQHDIGISYSFEGGAPITEIITDTIQPDSTYLHTFVPTVDMSEIGDYGFLIYSTLATDMAPFNDTLRRVISQLPRNDAAMQGFEGIQFPICDTIAEIGFIIQNSGEDTLTSVRIEYLVDGEIVDVIDWTGNLAPGESEVVTVSITASVGDHDISVNLLLPNGVQDEDPNNDSRTSQFTLVGEGIPVVFELLLDDYPNETSWELLDEDDNVIYSGNNYNQANTLITEEWCLEDECYTFKIYDTYGDGLLGFSADGSYRITNEEGIILVQIQNTNFGFEEVTDFCANQECSVLLGTFVMNESGPGMNDGRIVLTGNSGSPPYQYSIDGGGSYQGVGIFSNLPGGVYPVEIRDAINCVDRDTLTIITCTLELAAEVVNASTNGTSDGSITAMITGGIPPFEYSLNGGTFQDDPVFSNLMSDGYVLTVRDSLGCKQDLEVTVDAIVGLKPNIVGTYIEILPNPTDGFLRINVHGLQDRSTLPVLLYDGQGRLLKRERLVAYDQVLTNQISLHEFPGGVYYLRFVDERIPWMRKVVKE